MTAAPTTYGDIDENLLKRIPGEPIATTCTNYTIGRIWVFSVVLVILY